MAARIPGVEGLPEYRQVGWLSPQQLLWPTKPYEDTDDLVAKGYRPVYVAERDAVKNTPPDHAPTDSAHRCIGLCIHSDTYWPERTP